ncbi:Glycosyltransferase involved in cell wall bisynthesis [Actinacidiphila yanglinensis]|uniref:Glycosyltransferase involved in cell wall bisynthesis n=1 Tax=Actinacidiphila yanglinensis TaxID=310779 RepID=A0A1H6DMB4_9ACTN|nr:glycosyltransferase family 2 protein [Actinacidiphila yanglinensis]SEG86348.1 Glycosyltransferase involved in cell wall bisynthesis [Actinacidiphila yanglinensis]
MAVKVSVIVPVYNPGKYIEPCLASLLGQTLPAEEWELLLVDDGSTDDTPAMLDALAAEHSHVRVIHIPNSGWPGKPRNIGVTEARGEYVQFVDQDDHMGEDALRRLYELGHRNGSDVVIGKVASNFRGVPHGVFRLNRDTCTIHDAPLYDSLTPHKMFRTAFLRDNGIKYPEGKRRLEDQLYMMQAYFAARAVSILGDYTCYHYSKRDDGKNAGSARIVPAQYYDNLREVLDVVMANTEPGEFRDRVLRRFYRVEMLGRLSEPSVLTYEPDYLDQMVVAVHGLAKGYMGDGVHDGLGALPRIRSTMLRREDTAALLETARRASAVKGHARLEDFRWVNGRAAITVTARLRHEDGRPVTLLRRDGRYFLHPDFHQGLLDDGEEADVTGEMDAFRAEVQLRNRETAVEWSCPAEFEMHVEDVSDTEDNDDNDDVAAAADTPDTPDTPGASDGQDDRTARPAGTRCHVVIKGVAYLDPKKVRTRPALTRGMWDVWVPVRGLGLVRKARLGADRSPSVDGHCLPALLGTPARIAVPYFTNPHGNLTLDVDRRGKKLGVALAGRQVLRMPGTHRLEVELSAITHPGTAPADATLRLRAESGGDVAAELPATLLPVGGRVHLRADGRLDAAAQATVGAGTWTLSACLDGAKAPELEIGPVQVDRHGRIRLSDGLAVVAPSTARDARRQRRRAALRAVLRQVGGPLVRRMGPAGRKRARRWAGKLGA